MINELRAKGLDDQQIIDELADFGIDEQTALEIIAAEDGSIPNPRVVEPSSLEKLLKRASAGMGR